MVLEWSQCEEDAVDVVVVGSGAAGMNAAIYAARSGARVALLDKGAIGRSGASVQANVSASAAPHGGWELHVEDILRAGSGLARPELAEVLARGALDCFQDWHDWGVGFALNGDGSFVRSLSRGHSEARAVSPGYGMGEKVCRALRRQVHRLFEINCRPYTPAVDVLVNDGEVTGVLGWDIQQGVFVRIDSPSVIIATGGAQSAFTESTSSRHLTGDGFAMAVRAGARLVDMEFVLRVPVCLVSPRPTAISRTIIEPIRKVAGELRDANGQEFIRSYLPEDGAQAPWADLSRGIAQAVRDGIAFPDRTVRFVTDEGQLAAIEAMFPSIVAKLSKQRIDLREGVAVKPMAHFFPGGIAVSPAGESNIPGLFAAGEVAGGMFGSTRLGGDALTAAAVFGKVAGQSAAARSRARRPTTANRPLAEDRISTIVREQSAGTVSLQQSEEVLKEARRTLEFAGGPLRNAVDLRAGLADLASLPQNVGTDLGADPRMNQSFVNGLTVRNIVESGQILLKSALERTESLGAHFRSDQDRASRQMSGSTK